jgi:homocitrate synthase
MTQKIKALADQQHLTLDKVDEVLYSTFKMQHTQNPVSLEELTNIPSSR